MNDIGGVPGYKSFVSVHNISLHIQRGSIYGFLGSNGAGKSTTMKMLLGLTGKENLDAIRRILGLPESCVADALELVGLTESVSVFAVCNFDFYIGAYSSDHTFWLKRNEGIDLPSFPKWSMI